MTQNFERSESRLSNIQAIEPLIGALRTMSMGAWQMALNRIAKMNRYEDNYTHILVEILPYIKQESLNKFEVSTQNPEIADTIILIIGTERGLCGKFNEILAEKALSWVKEQHFSSYQIWAMGKKMSQKLEQLNTKISWRKPLTSSNLASYQQAYLTTQEWMEQYETYSFNKFIVLYNQLVKGGRHQFSIFNLFPYEIQHSLSSIEQTSKRWPPYIIETDPAGIYHQIIQHKITSSFYQILLESAAAEHSARFNLMQEAKDNAEEIIDELTRVIHAERRRQITQSMQELAAGAGLLDNQ
jgi:F-type H+-transporting ATPase subunit gamma